MHCVATILVRHVLLSCLLDGKGAVLMEYTGQSLVQTTLLLVASLDIKRPRYISVEVLLVVLLLLGCHFSAVQSEDNLDLCSPATMDNGLELRRCNSLFICRIL